MATYNVEYRYNPARRKKQRYALMERVVDFSKAPTTPGTSTLTTAWAANDVLEAVQIRAGQTVLGVQVEIMELSGTANAKLKIGYGDDDDYWGFYDFSQKGVQTTGVKNEGVGGVDADSLIRNFGTPVYFSSKDTVDITINKAITNGRVRLIVHLLEDDR